MIDIVFFFFSKSSFFGSGDEKKKFIIPVYHQFIERMDLAYASADVVVSRAGALSISELCLVGKPTILVPSPNVSEDHQTKNAQALVEKSAAILVKDSEAKDTLISTAFGLLKNEEQKAQLSQNIKTLAKPNATKAIVEEILKLVKK